MTGECLRTLGGHGIQIWRVAFSPDGRTIATGAEDKTIALWDVENRWKYWLDRENSDNSRS